MQICLSLVVKNSDENVQYKKKSHQKQLPMETTVDRLFIVYKVMKQIKALIPVISKEYIIWIVYYMQALFFNNM